MLGSIIGGIASLATGLFNRSSNDANNEANRQAQAQANAANIAQAERNNEIQLRIAGENAANQREFAQQGIRWKVADAQAAGLHPLAALGSQGISYSPIAVGTSSADIRPSVSTASTLPDMGQNITRAINATRTGTEKVDAYTHQLQALQLERGSLENTLLKAQILKTAQPEQPSFPSITDTPSNFVPLPRPGPSRTMGGIAYNDDDKIEQKPESAFPVKTLRMYGAPIEMPSWLSSGQDWEDALGEVGGSAAGLANLPGIIWHNARRQIPEFQKRMGNPFDSYERYKFNRRFHFK